ncbi:hybrid sensor histidine kinase/response regulator [Kiloniella laminariae]|uniref:histidine kinase n=1 Tax=Kiloniella laminariae TaxID=454162 RepID=A0ABT4LF65_9PROT|nr:hybrid sensor histidine kinase/response regulator [Kiloniella laminariae]MCZ4279745.1 hybrid sensor histidine kinase/response regulator [Kiloniella laminariae]
MTQAIHDPEKSRRDREAAADEDSKAADSPDSLSKELSEETDLFGESIPFEETGDFEDEETDDFLMFAEAETDPLPDPSFKESWNILIVDDDPEVHDATVFVLRHFEFKDKGVRFHHALSAQEAKVILEAHPEIEILLLDVVMETQDAGLQLVKWIRDVLKNKKIRILLRTGQPGDAPEKQIIRDYDINDYKSKAELTASMLFTSLYASCRGYHDLITLENQTLQLGLALANQQQQNKMQSDFISMASHEFRTPVAIIDSSVQRLERRLDDLEKDFVDKRLRQIKAATQRMLTLIDSTLSASRIEAGEIEIELGSVDLAGMVAKLCNSQQDISDRHKITYDVRDLPRDLLADRSKMVQVFTNLLSNAVKYAPNAPEVIVKGWVKEGNAYVSVQDFGIGIAPEDHDKIFTRYFRSRNTSGISGTGIGLCLVSWLLEVQGGSITFVSELNVGSTFTVKMPVQAKEGGPSEYADVPLCSEDCHCWKPGPKKPK